MDDKIAIDDQHQHQSGPQIKVDICTPHGDKLQSQSVMVNLPYIKDISDSEEISRLTKVFLDECTKELNLKFKL